MNVDNLREYLDGLIAEVRAGFNPVDSAMLEIAGTLHRYGMAEQEIITLGNTLRQMRQPVPLQTMPQGQPLPPEQPTRAQLAEAHERAVWEAERARHMNGQG